MDMHFFRRPAFFYCLRACRWSAARAATEPSSAEAAAVTAGAINQQPVGRTGATAAQVQHAADGRLYDMACDV
eukprot:1159577-Pelagomonas_calceolata.AAC.2